MDLFFSLCQFTIKVKNLPVPSVIDTTFNVYSDAGGRDPDIYSKTLRRYHKLLWSKPLPDGAPFDLSDTRPGCYLHHASERGEFILSSDSLGHTYRTVKSMAGVVGDVPTDEMDRFFAVCSTVGAYIVFPARRIEGKNTINGARGFDRNIRDRFDLTLECIRRHYNGEDSPLGVVLARYADFFALFGSFRGYTEFFLLRDLVSADGEEVRFFLPFNGFGSSPLPADVADYRQYRDSMVAFVTARGQRMVRQHANNASSG